MASTGAAYVRGSRSLRRLALIGSVAAVVGWAGPGFADPPKLFFNRDSVVVSSLTAGGQVAIFGVGHGFNGFVGYEVYWHQVLEDEDSDGSVQFDLDFPLPPLSVWAAVDLTTGERTLLAPTDNELYEIVPDVVVDTSGCVLTDGRPRLELMVVRPGTDPEAGAWRASVGDGGVSDGDGEENLSVEVSLSSFEPLKEPFGEAPCLVTGDVVIGIDPGSMEIYAF